MAGRDISFELERFEWVTPERLEVEGSWHGVRRLVRATLLIEVDGETRRLRALPEDPGAPEQWTAAFEWKGGEMPKLDGAELEVGRSIVVDLPRPRTSKARGDAKRQKPIPATTRADKANEAALEQVRADKEGEKESLRAEVARLEAEAESLRAAASGEDALRAELDSLHAQVKSQSEQADTLRGELEELRARAETAEADRNALETRVKEATEGADAARAEHESLRAQARDADSLRSRVEDAEAQRDALRAQADEAVDLRNEVEALRAQLESKSEVKPDVARLRAELESVERERGQLRAQLDATSQRLEDATQAMPPPAPEPAPVADARERLRAARRFDRPLSTDELAVEAGRGRARRPAERTAKRESAEPATSLADKVTGWVGTVIGTRDEEQGAKNGESGVRARSRSKSDDTVAHPGPEPTAPLPARRPGPRPRRRTAAGVPHAERRQSPSWPLRAAAIGLLALLLVTLAVIVSSIL
jgi:hypothetical protein